MTKTSVDPMVGRTVAQYEILDRLGGGGMGVVYRARDHKLGRQVALKFLPEQWSHDDTAKHRFVREAQAASATQHPNICTIHDVAAADDGRLFIVMAYYEGETLKQRLESGPLAIDEALDIATQAADGLARAHAQGVVHRDVKPGNLILTEDGVRIVDFGLATFADALQLTAEGSTLGTAAYMSPEQVRGDAVDARTDVWALGVVLYQMLTGHVPFRGSYAEAIAYAIRNDPPPPIRAERPDVPEDVEQLVFRALHKDPAVRFASGREMARALRHVRGLSVPVDLRTQPVDVPAAVMAPGKRPRTLLWAGAAVMVLAGATAAWLLTPVERIPVVVAPVANLTGFPELDGYGFALAEALAGGLARSAVVRVSPTARTREVLLPFRVEGKDPAGVEASRVLADFSGAAIVLIPSLQQEDGEIRARVEVWNPAAATREAVLTDGITSSLLADAAYSRTLLLAPRLEDHFAARAPLRAYVAHRLRRMLSGDREPEPRVESLEAAVAFERGLDAYDRLEYAAALEAFAQAGKRDVRNPLIEAWTSRTLLMMRQDADAAEAAERAIGLLAGVRPSVEEERLFIEATVAEARRELEDAEARYLELVEESGEDVAWLAEYGAFLDRRGRYADAAARFQRVRDLAPKLARPEVELCRLFGPARLNDGPTARRHAAAASEKYRALQDAAGSGGARLSAGEAQAAMCLSDVLRLGAASDRAEARRIAEQAVRATEGPEAVYQHARALYYLGMAAGFSSYQDAARFTDQALRLARQTRNRALEPFLLQNLGVAHRGLGNRQLAVDYYRQSAAIFNELGDEQRAAELQANSAAMLIEFGGDPDVGLRGVQMALGVSRNRGNRPFEVFALQVSAAYYRNAGRHRLAEEQLNAAISISSQQNLNDRIPSLTIDLARSLIETGDYARARQLVQQVIDTHAGPPAPAAQSQPGEARSVRITGREHAEAVIRLALIDARLGDFAAARAHLASIPGALDVEADPALRVLFPAAAGEVEYEAGSLAAARAQFQRTASLWEKELPHARTVEALGYVAFLDVLASNGARGADRLAEVLAQAKEMGRVGLEARFRIFLARAALLTGQAAEARQHLDGVPPDTDDRTIGPELRAQVLYWRGQALRAAAERSAGDAAVAEARRLLDGLRTRLPPDRQAPFTTRTDIQPILQ